jgi:hypothetical protein
VSRLVRSLVVGEVLLCLIQICSGIFAEEEGRI